MRIKNYIITILSYTLKPRKRKLIKLAMHEKNKVGLEIGGPSSFFNLKGYFPVYLYADRIDGVNFSTDTVWEGKITAGLTYQYFEKKRGFQFITEASELNNILENEYDFLLSCHSLEHVANPIKALIKWNKVLKENGRFILILPDKDLTFDHFRPFTTFQHLLDDYNNNINEHDSTHFKEITEFHDIAMDIAINPREELKNRLRENFEKRYVHHHVFNFEVIKLMLEYCGFRILFQQKANPFHLITYAVKHTTPI